MDKLRLLAWFFLLSSFVRAGHMNGIIITEVIPDDVESSPGDAVELWNSGSVAVDVAGWVLGESSPDPDTNDTLADYTGPFDIGVAGTTLQPGWFAVIVDPDYDGRYNARIQKFADLTKVIMITQNQDTTLGGGGFDPGGATIFLSFAGGASTFTWTARLGKGISWERKSKTVSPNTADQNERTDTGNVWARNIDVKHTLGFDNSWWTAAQFLTEDLLSVAQSPFSPHGDVRQDGKTFTSAIISYKTADTSRITLRVFNSRGQVVRTLIQEGVGGQGFTTWDGRDDAGDIAPVGIYLIHIESTDDATGERKQDTKTVILGRRFK